MLAPISSASVCAPTQASLKRQPSRSSVRSHSSALRFEDLHAARLVARFGCYRTAGKQLPVPLGDDFDGAVDDFDGGLVVDRIRRPGQAGGPPFGSGHRDRQTTENSSPPATTSLTRASFPNTGPLELSEHRVWAAG